MTTEATPEVAAPENLGRPLAAIVQISDTHICHVQSKLRFPFVNRYLDPHHPLSRFLGEPINLYRPQEALGTQVLNQMISTINSLGKGPLGGRKIDLVAFTGDVTDNAQVNELSWFQDLLDGRPVDLDQSPIFPGSSPYDRNYFNPEGTPENEKDDYPRAKYGFPQLPGLVSASLRSHSSPGLKSPWLVAHGNHDGLVVGALAPMQKLRNFLQQPNRLIGFSSFRKARDFARGISAIGPTAIDLEVFDQAPADPDSSVELIDATSWQQFGKEKKYYVKPLGQLTLIILDTVNPNGGWDGSVDQQQFDWLRQQLVNAKSPVILISHHPLSTLTNLFSPSGEKLHGKRSFQKLLNEHSHILMWLAGHQHKHRVQKSKSGALLIETSSLIDWPQQGRFVEVFETDNSYQIALSVFDHNAPVSVIESGTWVADVKIEEVATLASASRQLAANHWQHRKYRKRLQGRARDREFFIEVPKPKFGE